MDFEELDQYSVIFTALLLTVSSGTWFLFSFSAPSFCCCCCCCCLFASRHIPLSRVVLIENREVVIVEHVYLSH